MILLDRPMDQLIHRLRHDNPDIKFVVGESACWSPKDKRVYYQQSVATPSNLFAVFHEVGHARLDHASYQNDLDLLQKESAAWQKAKEIARIYGFNIDNDRIQDCLDTYREWLHKRSACVSCGSHGIQNSKLSYFCVNCHASWRVSASRFCRVYRLGT